MEVFSEVLDDTVYVGFHKIDSKAQKSFQILVRPDVSEESLLNLSEQILLSCSGAVSRHLQSNSKDSTKDATKILSPYLESSNQHNANDRSGTTSLGSLPWLTIRAYLGVNMDLQRCSVLTVQPTPAAAGLGSSASVTAAASTGTMGRVKGHPGVGTPLSDIELAAAAVVQSPSSTTAATTTATTTSLFTSSANSAVRRQYLEFTEHIASQLHTAMREESLTIDYMHSVPAALTGPMQGIHSLGMSGLGGGGMGGGGGMSGNFPFTTNNNSGHFSGQNQQHQRTLDSIIDLGFIRDLQVATSQLLVSGQLSGILTDLFLTYSYLNAKCDLKCSYFFSFHNFMQEPPPTGTSR